MTCPVCPAAGFLGGWVGGYFGVKPPEHSGGRLLSAAITANLIAVSIIGLKAVSGISLCVGGTFNIENIIRVGLKALFMGVIYSIGINYILNRYVYSSPDEKERPSGCGCGK